MSKSNSKKFELSTVIMIVIVAGAFLAFIGLLSFALFRISYVKGYMRQLGVNLTGDVAVYAEVDGEKYLLSRDNSNHICQIAVIGTINMKRSKDKTSGQKFVLISIPQDDLGLRRTTTIEELDNSKAMITVENENGKKVVVLEDTRFLSLKNVIVKNLDDGGNQRVEDIP